MKELEPYEKGEMSMLVLVTGCAGFIGFHLAKRLLEQGIPVVGIDSLNDYYDVRLKEDRLALLQTDERFTFYRNPVEESSGLEDLFRTYSFTHVVHLAAQAGVRYSLLHPEAYIESNVVGFFSIMEAVRKNAPNVKHFVYASSSSVYGANRSIPFSEEDQTDTPVNLYAATKKSNELMAYAYSHLYGIRMTGLRFFTVYGPWGRPDMAYYSFAKKIMAGEEIRVFNHGRMKRDFTYIDDIVEGLERVLRRPPYQTPPHAVYNLGNWNAQGLMDLIALLEENLGKKANLRYEPMQPGEIETTYADMRRMGEDFSFSPKTDLASGIAAFTDWFKSYHHEFFPIGGYR